MKFSNSLKFNAVAEWWDEYIAYSSLKKHIYQLEKKQLNDEVTVYDLESNERTALMSGANRSSTDAVFIPILDRELKKICLFYEAQEQELSQEVLELEKLVQSKEEEDISMAGHYMSDGDDDDDDDDDDEPTNRPGSRERTAGRASSSRRRRTLSTAFARPSATISEESPIHRRHSISSSEGNLDLEASLASLRHNPDDPVSPSRTHNSSKSTKTKLANLFNLVIPGGTVNSAKAPETIWTARTNYAIDTRILFKRRITNLYISLTSLKSYVELNYSGFRKILKKYDKITYSELKDTYLHEVVEDAHPFTYASKDHLNATINLLVDLYTKCVTSGDHGAASRQLKARQREQIAWDRDTVWRQMIGRERRGESDGQVKALGGRVETIEDGLHVPTPVGRFKITMKKLSLVVAIVIFSILLNVQTVDGEEANRCFAILIFCTIMWATEAIPLFVTSMLVPLLLVCLRVIRSPDGKEERLDTSDATKYIFQQMFSPTIMLLIGGFTIASALSKTNIDRILITRVLSLAGTRPSTVLLAFMGVACFASMWISNVAAPTLCFTLIRPILRTLPPKSPFAPCLILGIALAANIGGQSSPISSPQNLIALGAMEPPLDWAQWFAVALPVSAVSILLIWLLLLASYRPSKTADGEDNLQIKATRPTKESFTAKQYWVSFVCLFTIALWCVEKEIEGYVGDMGIIAIIPIVAFFSTGVLRKDDFEQFLWTIVFLAMGGIALGKGVTSSGLLEVMDEGIRHLIRGRSLNTVVLVLSVIVLIVSTFISHTIASVLLVPIAKEVGSNLPGDRARLLIFLTGLICSTGMGMPVSGFPNQTAATQEDEMGTLYLSNIDFLKNGVPASIIATLVVATVGFGLMQAIGL
ncbi:SPX-domain-containing protein [Rickenella mellea]|uniref:SPX-domain-containing protein n=1 Tax=Rickenella mellea TaxID=50990 RepID=A0A4Y7QDY9_9AGAM|nr:SPX-domain-containing protein [Rickenella mellea]